MQFDRTQYKVWSWKHPLLLHWVINPGLAINEVFLGQRVPRVMLIKRSKFESFAERSLVPCPHCDTMHPSLKWTPQNKTAFGNWFGLYCDHCGNTIPCLHNLTSLLLWGISFPFWAPFRKRWKAKWLEQQKEKFAQPLDLTTPAYNWVQEGIGFGFLMYIFQGILWPLIDGKPITGRELLIGILPALLGGLMYGWIMRWFFKRVNRVEQKPAS